MTGRLAWGARLAALLAIGALVAACGSSGGGSAGGSAGGGTAATGTVTVTTATGSDGTYLTDGSGRALYLWVADKDGRSTCSGACASAWPPVTVSGTPAAAGSADASELGTVARSGGARQVTYAGHPLYYYAGDHGTATSGQGSDGFGAKWWLVAPSGSAITGAGPTAAASTAATAGAGGGYY